jgi:hypothetical protein
MIILVLISIELEEYINFMELEAGTTISIIIINLMTCLTQNLQSPVIIWKWGYKTNNKHNRNN